MGTEVSGQDLGDLFTPGFSNALLIIANLSRSKLCQRKKTTPNNARGCDRIDASTIGGNLRHFLNNVVKVRSGSGGIFFTEEAQSRFLECSNRISHTIDGNA
jgi:hypothetical protein